MVVIGRRETNTTQFPISRSQIAVAIGVPTFIFLLFFRHQFSFFADPPTEYLKADYSPCGSTEKLKAQNARLSSMVAELKKQVRDLNRKLTEQEPIKAGRFGTVKGSSTNPPVFPDETVNPRLAKILSKVAVRRELIVGLANSNVKPTLQLWFTSIKNAGIKNYLVVALDTDTLHFCESNNVPAYQPDPDETLDSVGKMAHSHAVSGLKFRVLREFLQMGYSVLLSDIDIVYLQNPFDHLYRDSDVESMSDGHNNMTAYGFDDVFDDPEMGWSRYVHSMRIWVYNSGFFYIRPTVPSIELLDRVVSVMERDEEAWDQTVFNEELFYPSSPGYVGLHASRRTMDMYLFMNSKVLFRRVRKDKDLRKMKPVVVHVNYHPDKVPRMRGVYEFYVDGKEDALDSFSDAEEWNPN